MLKQAIAGTMILGLLTGCPMRTIWNIIEDQNYYGLDAFQIPSTNYGVGSIIQALPRKNGGRFEFIPICDTKSSLGESFIPKESDTFIVGFNNEVKLSSLSTSNLSVSSSLVEV